MAEHGGDRLRRASRTGAIGRGIGLRARRDHGGRAGRNVRVRRARHALGHAARPVRLVRAAQRPAAGGAAVGAGGRPDGNAARSSRSPSIGSAHGRRRRATSAVEEIRREEQPGGRALCGAIIAGSLIVAGTNVWLVRSLGRGAASPAPAVAPAPASATRRPVIAMMPKAKGDPYFISCRAGAEEAAKELGVDLIWDGPTSLDAARQNELVENWITRKVDVIAVAVENRGGISSVLRKARERGIKVLTWDADAEPDARDFFVNQATPEGIANTLTDEAARLLGGTGEFAIITGALSAANQNEWIAFIRKRLADKYPDSSSRRSARATTTGTRRLPRRRRSCASIRR